MTYLAQCRFVPRTLQNEHFCVLTVSRPRSVVNSYLDTRAIGGGIRIESLSRLSAYDYYCRRGCNVWPPADSRRPRMKNQSRITE